MPRLRSILFPAAAAGLLASGCDYWKNLTQDISPDRGRVTLTVLDALTGERMPDASCGKEGEEAFEADENGVIVREDMPTGKHKLVCRAPRYHVRTVTFELDLQKAATKTVQLVRLGGDNWYPERQVEILPKGGNGKYPGPIVFEGSPRDDSGRFYYKWTSSLHQDMPACTNYRCSLFTAKSDLDSQKLDMTLAVSFQPEGDTGLYPVRTINYSMTLYRNQPPEITSPHQFISGKANCFDQPYDAVLGYTASDPDQGCHTVKVTSLIRDSPVGVLDTVLPCGSFPFPVKLTPNFPKIEGRSTTLFRLYSYIRFEVVDVNGESDAVIDTVETTNNLDPEIIIIPRDTGAYVFTDESVRCSLFIADAESGSVASVVLDWGDGEVRRYDMDRQDISKPKIYDHIYSAKGDYEIKATVHDRCKGVGSDTIKIKVKENSALKFQSITPSFDQLKGKFKLNVQISDEDVTHGLDSVTLFIKWDLDNSTAETTFTEATFVPFNSNFYHAYDPSVPDTVFKIYLNAVDRHRGDIETLLKVPRSVAIPNQALWMAPALQPLAAPAPKSAVPLPCPAAGCIPAVTPAVMPPGGGASLPARPGRPGPPPSGAPGAPPRPPAGLPAPADR